MYVALFFDNTVITLSLFTVQHLPSGSTVHGIHFSFRKNTIAFVDKFIFQLHKTECQLEKANTSFVSFCLIFSAKKNQQSKLKHSDCAFSLMIVYKLFLDNLKWFEGNTTASVKHKLLWIFHSPVFICSVIVDISIPETAVNGRGNIESTLYTSIPTEYLSYGAINAYKDVLHVDISLTHALF